MSKTFLFKTIQFSISTQFSSIWHIDGTLSGPTTPGQSGPGNDGNEKLLRISQSSSITGPLQDRVDQGTMAMKGYSEFPNVPALLEPHHQIV